MRTSLRRSCDACARSKLRCDLLSPRCSRCLKKGLNCVYANEPLSSATQVQNVAIMRRSSSESAHSISAWVPEQSSSLLEPTLQSFDPFDSYPRTRLPRLQVQQLIRHFLSNIAFQYYPLDLDSASNPFVVSWWPLALADPALFHVSLQTASLDVDLRTQRGFATSDLLMADSVSLVRSKVEGSPSTIQDELLDSVVTLAAIEYGKGNVDVSKMHIEGVKSMVQLRGGIDQVKIANPLTARMVSWVSLILLQSPQFDTRNDFGEGSGMEPPRQWTQAASSTYDQRQHPFHNVDMDLKTRKNLLILNHILHNSNTTNLPTADLHDLACFVLHRLLASIPVEHVSATPSSLVTNSAQYAAALYMLVLHGPTYFSHAFLQHKLIAKLQSHLEALDSTSTPQPDTLLLWLVSVGLVASQGTPEAEWFINQASSLAGSLQLFTWSSILSSLKSILWLDRPHAALMFQNCWEDIFSTHTHVIP